MSRFLRSEVLSLALAGSVLVAWAGAALASEPYVGLWAKEPKDCATKTVPPLIQVDADAAYWDQFYCPTATFTPAGEGWSVHIECVDPMAGPGDEGGDSFDYRFSVVDGKLHWDPVGEGTGTVLMRCPG